MAERRGPCPASHHHLRATDFAVLRHHAGHAARFGQDTTHRTVLHNLTARPGNTLRDDRHRAGRIGDPVALGEHAATPDPTRCLAPSRRFLARQHVADDVLRGGEAAPAGPAFDLGFAVAEIEQAASAKADVVANLVCEAIPELQGPGRHRQLAGVAVLLAAPSPVPAGLFATYDTLLQQCDGHPAPSQVVGRGGTHDAATDHDDIRLPGQPGAGFKRQQWCGHADLRPAET